MKISASFLALLATTLLILSTPAHSSKFLERIPGDAFITDDLRYFAEVAGIPIPTEEELLEQMRQSSASTPNNTCINGQDPSKLSTQQQLLQFVQGPCSPFIIVPGFLASKLSVMIDCQTLQSQAPDIFSSCGWKTCDPLSLEPHPKSEYIIWVTKITGDPMSYFIPSKSLCWANLFQLMYDPSSPTIPGKYVNPPGVAVTVFGGDSATQSQGECGLGAATDLLNEPFQLGFTNGFINMKNTFVSLGYQPGLSLFAVPYDWRITIAASGVIQNIYNTIEMAYNLTGKPVVLITHSYGNLGTIKALNQMSFSQKQQMVANWISFMPPINGAPLTFFAFLGGNLEFKLDFLGIQAGITCLAERIADNSSSGGFDLIPQPTFEIFANEPWMIEWSQRQYLENTYNVTTPQGLAFWQQAAQSGNYPLSWFPTPLNNCTVGFTQKSSECSMNTYNFSNTSTFTINDNGNLINFTTSFADLQNVLANYSAYFPNWQNLLNDSLTNNISALENPEVPVTLIFGVHLATAAGGYYDGNPYDYVSQNKFIYPTSYVNTMGDGTVPTTGSLIPGIKWAWEYNNKVGNAQPVKFMGYCSVYNQRGTPYDVLNPDAPYEMTSVEYIGLDCSCLTGTPEKPTDGTNCKHADAPTDPKITDFAVNVAFTNFKVANYQNTGACMLTNAQLIQASLLCPAMNPATSYSTLINSGMYNACGASIDE